MLQDGRSKSSRHYENLGGGKNLDSFGHRGVAIAAKLSLRKTVYRDSGRKRQTVLTFGLKFRLIFVLDPPTYNQMIY